MKKIYFCFLFLTGVLFAMSASCSKKYSLGPVPVPSPTPTATPYSGCIENGHITGFTYTIPWGTTPTAPPTPVAIPTITGTPVVLPLPTPSYIYTPNSTCGGTLIHNLTEWQSYWTAQNIPAPAPPTDFTSQMVFFPTMNNSYTAWTSLDQVCYDNSHISIYQTTFYGGVYCSLCPLPSPVFTAYLIPRSGLPSDCYSSIILGY